MEQIILNGKETAQRILEGIKKEVHELLEAGAREPHLAVVLVGDDKASQTYVKNKIKTSQRHGLISSKYELPKDTTQEELLEVINHLNFDDDIDGILVQLPLPKHLNEKEIVEAISVDKDVDGLTPTNIGNMILGSGFVPCTPKGIMELLEAYQVVLEGKHVVIVGRSHLVGRPLIQLMLDENATVTITHSKTKNLPSITKQADVLVVAIGRQEFISEDFVKPGVIIVDVGINRDEDGIHGDVDQSALAKASMYTPVPKGVGPMTIAMLLENTMIAYRRREHGKDL